MLHSVTVVLACVAYSSVVHVSAEIQCADVEALGISVNDTAEKGDVVHDLGTNFSLRSDCMHFTANGTMLLLNYTLRKPCTSEVTLSCYMNCGQSSSRIFVVTIIKLDAHPPKFPKSEYSANVTELSATGTTVIVFDDSDETRVTDKDCIKGNTYEIEESDGGNFTMPIETTGTITTNGTIVYDTQTTYTLLVRAGSNGKYDTTTLVINVLDSDNKNPAFDHGTYNLNITEGPVATDPFTTTPAVHCYDQDVGINATVQYEITGMDSFLTINPTTGKLRQTASLNREHIPSWRLELKCYQEDDRTKTATAFVEVTVLDVNDHLPVFEPQYLNMTVSVVEHSVGVVATVLATDKDEGENAEVIYKIVQGENIFSIGPTSGVISVKSPNLLDREGMSNITILVRAEDRMGNFSAENASVLVTLLDLNDNSPVFEQDKYVFLFNISDLGSVIGTVEAPDADVPNTANSNVTYETLHSWTVGAAAQGFFPLSLGALSGEISITNTVSPGTQYFMLLQACDNPVNRNNKRCNSVQVLSEYGLNTTESVDVSVNMTIHENVPLGTVIGQTPLTGNKYTVSTLDFEVDEISHMLKTNTTLDRESQDTYEFIVSVFSDNELQVGNISVTLTVLDVNDHQPAFSQQEYFFSLTHQDTGNDVMLGKVESEDKDMGENNNRSYSLQSSPVSGLFIVDPQSGSLTLSQAWEGSGFRQTLFVLVVRVTDHGTPSLQSTAQIYISTLEMVDNSSVVIYTDASAAYIRQETERLQRAMAAGLGVYRVTFEEIKDETSQLPNSRSSMRIKALYENGTTVSFEILARSVIEHWYSVQDLFRTQQTGEQEHSDTTLQVAEIALIVVAGAILLGALIAVPIVCRQWKSYVREHRLYDNLRRPSKMYDSQELNLNFTVEETPRSQYSSFRNSPRKEAVSVLDTSFGVAYVSPVFLDDDGNSLPPLTPTWGSCNQPRIPRWSTTDSLKDAMASLEDLSNRLNAEDSISGVTELSRTRSMKSQNSFKDTVNQSMTTSDGNPSEEVRDWDTVDTDDTVIVAEIGDVAEPEPDYIQDDTGDTHDTRDTHVVGDTHDTRVTHDIGDTHTIGDTHDTDDMILMSNGDVSHSRTADKPVETHTMNSNTNVFTIEQSTKF